MPDEQITDLLREASSCADSVHQSLLGPATITLQASWPLLERAAALVESLNQLLSAHSGPRNPAWSGMAAELRRKVAQLGALLESAGAFNSGYTVERMPST